MTTYYNLEKANDGSIKLWSDLSVTEVYRYNYNVLRKGLPDIAVNNPFIVYILCKKGIFEKDTIYIGKSKNGLRDRPIAHEDKSPDWNYCYVLTESGSLLNDGYIQYIEDQITEKARNTNRFTITTNQTTKDTINDREKRRVNPLLSNLVEMLDILGLDLITAGTANNTVTPSDNSNRVLKYHVVLKHGKVANRYAEGIHDFSTGTFTLLKGSKLTPVADYSERYRGHNYKKYCQYIDEGKITKEGIVMEDLTFGGPSTPTIWYGGGDGDCYHDCYADDGRTLYKVREDLGLGLSGDTPDSNKSTDLGLDGKTNYHVTLVGKGFEKVRHAEGTYDFATNTFILLAGAELCPPELYVSSYKSNWLENAIKEGKVINNVTVNDLVFRGPSTPCSLYMGMYVNGYEYCKTDDNSLLSQVRKNLGIAVTTRDRR